MSTFLSRWFGHRPTRVDQHDPEAAAAAATTAAAPAVLEPAPPTAPLPPPPPAPTAAPVFGYDPPRPMTAVEHVSRLLVVVSLISKLMMVFTFVQIMCSLQVEQVHFLTLYSIFVPWSGFEGVRERNFAYLRLFYWGCLIMIPTNCVHYYSFDEFVDSALVNTTLSDSLKNELRFNQVLFNIVTLVLVLLMTVSVALVSRLGRFRALLQPERNRAAAGAGGQGHGNNGNSNGGNGGLLTSEEIAALPKCKIESKEDAGEICVICQDDFELGDTEAKRLHCKHLFHAKCIDAWLERSCLCPICNGDVRSIV
ncbi:hypothetical protein BASA81_004466 [Batrachochytrium salamandrivorans]|nr:hypothetical protein BASA81_004466 [Batrachochytrium salamandrivorans]